MSLALDRAGVPTTSRPRTLPMMNDDFPTYHVQLATAIGYWEPQER